MQRPPPYDIPEASANRYARESQECARRACHLTGILLCEDCGASLDLGEEHREKCVFSVP